MDGVISRRCYQGVNVMPVAPSSLQSAWSVPTSMHSSWKCGRILHSFQRCIRHSAVVMHTGVAEADAIVLMVDGQLGLHAGDQEILDWLRKNHPKKPVTLAVNKCESTVKADLQVCCLSG
jgi:hypothetical protein